MSKPEKNNKLELFDYNFPEDRQYSQGNKNQEYYDKIKKYNEEKRKAKTSRIIEKAIFWSFAISAVLVTIFSIYLLKNSLENSSPTLPQDNKIIVGSANLSTTIEEQQSKTTSTTSVELSTTTSTSKVEQQVIPTIEQTSVTTSVLAQPSTTESSKTSKTTIEEENESTEPSNAEASQTKASETTTTATQHSETTSKTSETTVKPTTEKPSETTTELTTSKQEYVYHIRFYIKSSKTNKVLGYYTSEMSGAEVSKVYKSANEQLAAESLNGETGTYYIVEEEYKVQK